MNTAVCDPPREQEHKLDGKPINTRSDAVRAVMLELILIEQSLKRINAGFTS